MIAECGTFNELLSKESGRFASLLTTYLKECNASGVVYFF